MSSRSVKIKLTRHGQFIDEMFEKHLPKSTKQRLNRYGRKIGSQL